MAKRILTQIPLNDPPTLQLAMVCLLYGANTPRLSFALPDYKTNVTRHCCFAAPTTWINNYN